MANEIIKGLGFHHIGLKARDFEKSKKFYMALGLKPISEWGEGDGRVIMLDIGDGGIVEIFAGGGDSYSEEGKWIHFAMKCEDVDAAYNIAVKAGGVPHILPKTVPIDSSPVKTTLNVAFVKGPDGEQVEFFKFV